MRRMALAAFAAAVMLMMSDCGGGTQSSLTNPGSSSTGTNPSAATVPVGLAVTDTPPEGVTVLFFQLSITAASLTSSSSSTTVSLLNGSNPIPVNVSQLQTQSAFLGAANVPAGAYSGLTLSLSNPQLTIFNGSGAAIGSCANETVCQLTPTITPSPTTLTFTSAPFPITLTATSLLAFQLDINLDTVIQQDLSVDLSATDGVTLSQIPLPPTGPQFPPVGHVTGTVQSVNASGNQFTIQTFDGRTPTINVNSSTTYSYPTSLCSADAFSCVATGQVVDVTISLQSGGSLLATAVNYVQPATEQTVEGTIVDLSTSNGTTTMDVIAQAEPYPAMDNMFPLGQHATVTVPATGVTYGIESGSFSVPTGLSFASSSDLQVGQEVLIAVQGSVTSTASGGSSYSTPFGRAGITFATNNIQLEPSQITGTVGTINTSAASFTIQTLPVLFVPPPTSANTPPNWAPVSITVATTTQTAFNNFTTDSISGLAAGDVVSVHGWLFSTPTGATPTTVAADAVMLRPGPSPLF